MLVLHGGEAQDGDVGDVGEMDEASGIGSSIVDPHVWTATGERFDPSSVQRAKDKELRRFEVVRVYPPVPRSQMESDPHGIKVDAKWIVTQKGTPTAPAIRARLVAQELLLETNVMTFSQECVG